MHLLDLPLDIRLRIYSELLVQDSPVEFSEVPHGKQCFSPALLRVNKSVNREAIPLLYSNNCFRFSHEYISYNPYKSDVADLAPFLRQIGANASLLRHICINFPNFFRPQKSRSVVLSKGHVQVLQLIRETCRGLRTVEILCHVSNSILSLCDVDLAAEMLLALHHGGFKAMPWLKKIVVVCEEFDIDQEDMAFRESLMQRMPSCIWSMELKKLPPRTWISDDDMVEFDNYEDCYRYNDELYRRQMEREEQEEQKQWEEEYYRGRNDPWWKNDSNFD